MTSQVNQTPYITEDNRAQCIHNYNVYYDILLRDGALRKQKRRDKIRANAERELKHSYWFRASNRQLPRYGLISVAEAELLPFGRVGEAVILR